MFNISTKQKHLPAFTSRVHNAQIYRWRIFTHTTDNIVYNIYYFRETDFFLCCQREKVFHFFEVWLLKEIEQPYRYTYRCFLKKVRNRNFFGRTFRSRRWKDVSFNQKMFPFRALKLIQSKHLLRLYREQWIILPYLLSKIGISEIFRASLHCPQP